ncbi:polysaccharide biosynthesis protein [Methylovorus menthalis]|uniref:polysaccharide biosynthesis protein n=1 Tax=Methylovorus menthalis TaxID=1002227 RepID=UPI001E2998C7|nr:nucleoside-diphosphate sugar epimerase/dehydratase [Methylovorus menthalis]MCB4811452.1 polysaccharide biosynthesis protein [Methylovorus menthalis]
MLGFKNKLRDHMPSYRRMANPRTGSAITHDVLVAVTAWYFAFALRFNFQIPPSFQQSMLQSMWWVVLLQFVFFVNFGLYRGVWRFASLPDLKRILFAVATAAATVVAVIFMTKPHGVIPRSVLILDPMLLVLGMGGSRFLYRYWKEHLLYGAFQSQGQPVILLGAGTLAINLLKDLTRSQEWRVVGMLDDDEAMHGRQLLGVKVLGNIEDIGYFARRYQVNHVIVAMPSASHQQRRAAVEKANVHALTILTVPSVEDLMNGKVSISQIRRVEVEDLLGREPVQLDTEGMHALLQAQVVMVSGAGGSIGSELCRQILAFKPAKLICLDISEFALYKLEQEFSAMSNMPADIEYVVGDVKNAERLRHLLKQARPAVIFHAAAYKHVPMMETGNVSEALHNNVLGTYTLASLAKETGVAKFVLISTDKAVNPTNVMGASKRLAEMVCQGLQESHGTRFVIVRFGNVLGSSGSVIPKFREQIAKGGPVTVTHPDITRYFMSIPEATQLVMQAGLMGKGSEIFVLDMGESVKIADLARDMIKLSGLQDDEIEIVFTGLRPGEKLYEELLADDEHTLPTPHEKLRIAIARSADITWVHALLKWVASTLNTDEATIKQELKLWVQEYQHQDINKVGAETKRALGPQSSTLH